MHSSLATYRKISTALDNNMFTTDIFLKAFTVDHKILISELHRYGFQDVIYWLSDYLNNRDK